MQTIRLDQIGDLFLLFAQVFARECDRLNALDSQVGDGDHGFTMRRAFEAVKETAGMTFPDIGTGFDLSAEALAENAGGAIGPLLAALFAEGGLVFAGKIEIGTREIAEFFNEGLQAVQEVGGAKPGDKTMVDALTPAAHALQQAEASSLEDALTQASKAAVAGAEATREMEAAHGRARFTAAHGKGYQDAGAVSMALIVQTWLDFVQGKRPAGEVAQSEAAPFSPPAGRFINHPDTMVEQDNQGLALAYPSLVRLHPEGVLLRATPKEQGKVALVIGHGGGHTPSMGGLIGPGLLDGDVYGPLFTCASGVRIAKTIELANGGGGVVLLVSNHSGDVLNARLAVRRAKKLGIDVHPVILGDDIATAPRSDYLNRRGLGGLLFALKIGGGAAEEGKPLEEVAELMEAVNQRTATLSVAGRAPHHPVTGQLLFELPEGQIEIGAGVHGEVGVYRGEHMPADQIVDLIVEQLVEDLAEFESDKMLAFINGSGGTSRMELHILYRRLVETLEARGITLYAGVVESIFTTFEMGGFSISLCAADEEMLAYWQVPASAANFRWPYS